MSTRRHKRRRTDEDADYEEQLVSPSSPADEPEEVGTAADPEPRPEAPTGELDTEGQAFAKDQEIWDAFKEEHYEVLEQLPLSLHRAFTLIQELDEQAQGNITNLTPAILKYVSLRRALAEMNKNPEGPPAGEAVLGGDVAQVPADSPHAELVAEPQPFHGNGNGKSSGGSIGSSLSPPPTSTPGPSTSRATPAPSRSLAAVIQDSDSTRELLIGIAQSAEEVSRASNEKYYLARHVYDLIDRYIRDLDRAIKEQEASISLGLRPGTHPASIILPEVVVPKLSRTRPSSPLPIDLPPESDVQPAPAPVPASEPTVQLVESPVLGKEATPPPSASPTEDEIIDITDDAEPETDTAAPAAAPASARGRRRGRKRRRFTRPPRERRTTSVAADENSAENPTQSEAEGDAEEREDAPRVGKQPPLTLKIPAQNVPPALPEGEVPDPNEPRYCFCNQVSYGEMIACDNPTCEREWFHLGCVGLARAPKGKWYCRDCAERVKRTKGKKRAR
ncbi:hypothetical protein OH76DRAFT_1408004 [Lentinus brumalis]|uniref:Chromatin modification-related protein n=1 Tax=Lentinus brumalis TaxID=2498619 RepID=A0A371CYS8_9APHY|nr:hypothetical protein OH76DRAFT_1408004 [Polyporus brumalis]